MDNDFRKTLKKKERLSVGTDLSRLFASGRYGFTDGFRYCYRIGNELPFNRIVVSVPKKCFRRAVKRNLLKRRIREAYRLNKNLLPVNAEKGGTDILFIYSSKDILDFNAVVLSTKPKNRFVETLKKVSIFPFIVLIKFYRTCISPYTPPACRFTPTCSEYALQAFRKWGPFKGLYLTVRRILRCHPWGGSGYDPVP